MEPRDPQTIYDSSACLVEGRREEINSLVSRCLSVRPSVRPSVCLSVCLFVCLSVCLFVSLSICLSVYLTYLLFLRSQAIVSVETGSSAGSLPALLCCRGSLSINALRACVSIYMVVYRSDCRYLPYSIECFHVTSSKSNFYTIHSRKLLLSYFLEFHKLSLHPKVWADMEILSGVTDI